MAALCAAIVIAIATPRRAALLNFDFSFTGNPSIPGTVAGAVTGEIDAAEPLLHEALPLQESLGNRAGTAVSFYGLTLVARQRGDLPMARDLRRKAIAAWHETGNALQRWPVSAGSSLTRSSTQPTRPAAASRSTRPWPLRCRSTSCSRPAVLPSAFVGEHLPPDCPEFPQLLQTKPVSEMATDDGVVSCPCLIQPL